MFWCVLAWNKVLKIRQGGMRWERAGHGNGIKSIGLVRKDIKFSVELVKVAERKGFVI